MKVLFDPLQLQVSVQEKKEASAGERMWVDRKRSQRGVNGDISV